MSAQSKNSVTPLSSEKVRHDSFFTEFFNEIDNQLKSASINQIQEAADLVIQTHAKSNKVIVVGNGGSASIASHLAIDFTKACQIRAINFNESSLLTCFSNDYGYENWVSEALKAYADRGDLLVLISSSGKSPNIINGALQAKDMGLNVITLSGFSSDNPLRKSGDINYWVDSEVYNIVEMTHHIWLVAIVDYIIEKNSI